MPTASRKNFARWSKLACGGLVTLSLQLIAAPAHAEEVVPRAAPEEAKAPSRFDFRFSTGFGRGYVQNTTTAYRVSLGADVWITPNIGLGGEVGSLLQVTALGEATGAWIFMPEFAYRSPLSAKSYLVLIGAVGYAENQVTARGERVECSYDCEDEPEYETELLDSHDLITSLQVGVVEYRGPVLFGFALRGDVIGLVSSNSVPVHGAATLVGSFGF